MNSKNFNTGLSKIDSGRWYALIAYMFVSALTQLFWLNFASVDTYMEKLLGTSAIKIGFLTLVFPITFLILSVPAGILTDRKGYKFSVGIGTTLIAVFSVLRLFAPNSYTMLLISQIGISLGQPFVLNSITKFSLDYFPKNEQTLIVGLGSLSLFIGMIIGLSATPFLVNKIGYVQMLWFYALLGVLGAVLFFLFTPVVNVNSDGGAVSVRSYFYDMLSVVRSRELILLGVIAFVGIGVFNGIATWLEKILNVMHHIPMNVAGNISGILVFSGMVGCIIIPELSDRFGRKKPFLIAGLIIAFFSLFIFATSKGGIVSDSVILGVMGFFAISVFPLMLSMSADVSGEALAGFSASFLQLLGNGAAVLIVPAVDMLYRATGGYKLPLLYLAFLFVIAAFSAVLIKEK